MKSTSRLNPSRLSTALLTPLIFAIASPTVLADDVTEAELAARYDSKVRAIVNEYCSECHSAKLAEADIDLVAFQSLSDVKQDLSAWQKVAEILDSQQMPPKDAKQLSDADRIALRTWLGDLLKLEAKRTAGDPGPVVLRRLNNAEYTYAIRDLTGIATLDPAKEFPADGAAGEGFTNAGNALSMSPALVAKYLDAGKDVASHLVLLPDGVRFSPSSMRRDWVEEILADIRALYAKYSAKVGATQVNLQGEIFDTNNGGRLPLDQYLLATLEERMALSSGTKSIDQVATERSLSRKYLRLLWEALNRPAASNVSQSLLLSELQQRWQAAQPDQHASLVEFVQQWQQALWRFSSVGHIGKVNGPKAWLEPTNPLVANQELRLKLPAGEPGKEITCYLVVGDAGDGNEQDFAMLNRPRLVAPGRPDLPLKHLRQVVQAMHAHREQILSDASQCLAIAASVYGTSEPVNIDTLASENKVSPESLKAWFHYLAIGTHGLAKIDFPLTQTISSAAGYDFVQGWTGDDALSVVANSSDTVVNIPGTIAPHSVAVHPSPTQQVAIAWQAPRADRIQVESYVKHAHPACGNGVAWSLEVRRGNIRSRLGLGTAQAERSESFKSKTDVTVQPGDLVTLLINPIDGNHSCDMTAVDLTIRGQEHTWNLAKDVSPNILAGNPHADQLGNANVWHFYREPTQGNRDHLIPVDSLLDRWQNTNDAVQRKQLAQELQNIIATGATPPADAANVAMLQQLRSFSGPLLSPVLAQLISEVEKETAATRTPTKEAATEYGLDPTLFGKHPLGHAVDSNSLCIKAPAVLEIRLPADLAAGAELVTMGQIHAASVDLGAVQFSLTTEKPASLSGTQSIAVKEQSANRTWTDNRRVVAMSSPIVVAESSAARAKFSSAFDAFRQLFPTALCYPKIVPVDEVVTLTLYYREDAFLQQLMLSDPEIAQLNRLWNELHFVSQDAFLLVDAYEQLWQYATQDADPSAFEPLREPIKRRAEEFRAELIAAEQPQIKAVMNFAERAYRRPLLDSERSALRELYGKLREDELPHDAALRMLMARILISPAFLYRAESGDLTVPATGTIASRPITDHELATRLSFFLWSSAPDDRLRDLADQGRLRDSKVLLEEAHRMLDDERTKRLATEFVCQWIQIYDFDAHDEKSEATFPSFVELRPAMYEEAIRFFTDLYQRDGSILELVDADHTFVNAALAKHYELQLAGNNDWQRVEGTRAHGRGGILGMAATLSKQSGASRTSPILRGNWICEVLIGEKLPKPPKNVPVLPESVPAGLTERQLIEQHSSDPACAKCHERIDPFGFSLEGFDAIGRSRTGPEINVLARLSNGTEIQGLDGLKAYLLNERRKDFVRQFCKKALGYALGRAVQLSDEPLLEEMQTKLVANNYRIRTVVDSIITSPQFQRVRVE